MKTKNNEIDLVTAAVIGVAVGLTAMFLLRRNRSVRPALRAAGRGIQRAGRVAGRNMAEQMRKGVHRGQEFVEDLPLDDIGDQLREYLDAAKEAVEDTVSNEMRALKKSIRRRRRRLGF